MKIVDNFFEITFENEDSKTAYLLACKWLAKNVIGKDEISEVSFTVDKLKDKDLPTFKITLYVEINMDEFNSSICDKCHMVHKSFFINQDFNCTECKITAYKNQLAQKMNIKREYRIEKLNRIISGE